MPIALPIRTHWFDLLKARLTLFFLSFLLVPPLFGGYFFYSRLVDTIKTSQASIVSHIADARHEQLKMVLTRATNRSQTFLANVFERCGSPLDNPGCANEMLRPFLNSENALGMAIHVPGSHGLAVGDVRFSVEEGREFQPGQLAQFSRRNAGSERAYRIFVESSRYGIKLEVIYPARAIQSIFVSHPDLGSSGETFLADGDGFFITKARYHSTQGHSHPISATPMQRCLSQENAATLDLDYRDVPIIHGFRFVPEIGGGCIMAHVDQAEAFVKLEDMKQRFYVVLLGFCAIAIFTSLFFAKRLAAPIARLTKVTQEIASGNPGVRAAPGGFGEIAGLSASFNAMADQLASINMELEHKVEERTQSLKLMSNVFINSGEGIVITDAENKIVAANAAFARITGYTEKEALGRDPKFLSAGKTPKETYREMWEALGEKGSWKGELWDRHKSGEIYLKELSIIAVRNKEGHIVNYIGSLTDITERKAKEMEVHHLAHHDGLTDLPNRTLLDDRLQQALAVARRDGTRLAVMFIDLDEFKPVNDAYGHHVGDLLLKEAALRMQGCVRGSDTVSRVGGDEFIVLLPIIEEVEGAVAVAEKIRNALSQPFKIAGHTTQISSSIGISFYPESGSENETLLEHADIAMYHAKQCGRNNVQLYHQGIQKGGA